MLVLFTVITAQLWLDDPIRCNKSQVRKGPKLFNLAEQVVVLVICKRLTRNPGPSV